VERGLSEEFGVYSLVDRHVLSVKEAVLNFIVVSDWLQALDAIEFIFYSMWHNSGGSSVVEAAIETLNERFRENQCGYQMENIQIVRVDSWFVHAEIVKPVLELLADPAYEGANAEFLSAFEHYLHGRDKECLVECSKAFESTLKIICERRQWRSSSRDVSDLVRACRNNGLIPAHQTKFFNGVVDTLVGGIALLRNELAAHGQGAESIEVPDYLVRYGLNVTATAILMLVEADKALDS